MLAGVITRSVKHVPFRTVTDLKVSRGHLIACSASARSTFRLLAGVVKQERKKAWWATRPHVVGWHTVVGYKLKEFRQVTLDALT